MKVIDLLNKIANGEEPKKIKYRERIYEKDNPKALENGYVCIDINGYYHWLNDDVEIDDINDLNDEIEIIEEDKKIKKLKHAKEDDILVNGKSLLDKIDEIIDIVNKLKVDRK